MSQQHLAAGSHTISYPTYRIFVKSIIFKDSIKNTNPPSLKGYRGEGQPLSVTHTSLSISFSGYFTVGSCSVTGAFFFLSPNRNILARKAVTPTTTVPTATGIPCK